MYLVILRVACSQCFLIYQCSVCQQAQSTKTSVDFCRGKVCSSLSSLVYRKYFVSGGGGKEEGAGGGGGADCTFLNETS